MTTNQSRAAQNGAPRPGRLRKAAEYQRVLNAGKTVSAAGRVVVRMASNDLGAPRLGIIVGRKAMKRAVDRNRAKRLCREAFRGYAAQLPAIDIVVQVRGQGSGRVEWRKFWGDLNRQLTALAQTGDA